MTAVTDKVLHVGIDVDDTSFHGAGFCSDTGVRSYANSSQDGTPNNLDTPFPIKNVNRPIIAAFRISGGNKS